MPDIEFKNYLSVDLEDAMGHDQSICRAARVSVLGSEAFDTEESAGLIRFLMKNRHGSPFEHNAMTFRVSEIIATSREFKRHRIGFSFNEESARYREMQPVFYIPPKERPLVQVGKAGAYSFKPGTPEQYQEMGVNMRDAYSVAWNTYQEMLKAGIAKEVARLVLPVGLYTSSYVTCNARSMMSFLSLRTTAVYSTFPSFPMWEIEQVAMQMEARFRELFPLTWVAFNDNGRVSP